MLNTIRYLRVLDMPLEQIADFLANRDINAVKEGILIEMDASGQAAEQAAEAE